MSKGEEILRLDEVCVNLGGTEVLRGYSLFLREGEMATLVGRNGAGKTTSLRAVMGLVPCLGGAIRIAGLDALRMRSYERAPLGVGYMPEDRGLIAPLTVEENILLPARANRVSDASERLAQILEWMPEIKSSLKSRASSLSGGQQKLVALARALMQGRRLLLLDEPFEGVSPVLSRRLAEVLHRIKNEGFTVLMSQSEEKGMGDLLDRSFRIERGANIEHTT